MFFLKSFVPVLMSLLWQYHPPSLEELCAIFVRMCFFPKDKNQNNSNIHICLEPSFVIKQHVPFKSGIICVFKVKLPHVLTVVELQFISIQFKAKNSSNQPMSMQAYTLNFKKFCNDNKKVSSIYEGLLFIHGHKKLFTSKIDENDIKYH